MTPPRVALFATCMVDTMYPGVGVAAVRLLESNGVEVVFPEEQTCCGQPAYNSGHRAQAADLAGRFLDLFAPRLEQGTIDAIVAPSGSCVAMVKHFPRLFPPASDAPRHRRARFVADRTYELTQYLVDVLGVTRVEGRAAGTLTYHPCCHLLRELGVDAQPRSLLAGVDGAVQVELPGAEECCGFGGWFAIENAPISTEMGRRKARHLDACGATLVAVNDVSCMTHLNGILARGHACRAVHIAELLAGPPSDPADHGEDPDAG